MPRAERHRELLQRAAGVTVPVLLVAVALFQLRQAAVHDQSSWSGAGFGMFATLDSEDSRFLRGYLLTPAGQRPTPLPPELRDEALGVRVLPTAERLQGLARAWRTTLPPGAGALRVEVWRVSLLDDGPRLEARLIRAVRVEGPAAG